MLAPGTRLATYEVCERLAVGGMGEVYLCRHRLLDRIDAVKVLRPHLVADEAFRRRFLREALAAARLRHPHIVTVYTADEVDGQLYLAMEYVPGADLAAVIERDGGLEPRRVAVLLAQVADALDAAHRLTMTHRDVKPSNVLVERPGEPNEHAYLVDFGLSKSQHAVDQNITQSGQVLGSVAYIAPEQLEGKDADGRCDQYSLACMAFECLTGRLPFPYENQIAVLTAHLTTPPPAVSSVRPGLPAGLDTVIVRGMAKSPNDRYPTCGAFVAALKDALTAPAGPAGPAPPVRPTRGPSSPPSSPPAAPGRAAPGAGPAAGTGLAATGWIVPETSVAAAGAAAPASPPAGEPPPMLVPPSAATRTLSSYQLPEAPAAPAEPPEMLPGPQPRVGIAEPTGIARPPARADAEPTGQVRLYLAVVGGPQSGQIIPLPDGDHSAAGFTLQISGWAVHLHDPGEARVNGDPAGGSRALRPGDLVESGPSLFEVRAAGQLAQLRPGAIVYDPVTVSAIAHQQIHLAKRGPQHPHAMVTRVGWRPGRPPGPLSISLGGATAVALRGEPEPVGAVLRWILAQAMVLHDSRDLCIAVAADPVGADRWTWLASAPHARPGTPPISGPHWANTREGAADLVARLRSLIEVRRLAASGGPAHHASAVLPRVLVVLDDRLGTANSDYLCTLGPRLGVHLVRLISPTERQPPPNCGVCVDVAGGGRELVLRAAGQSSRSTGSTGVPDGVSLDYARDVAETLAEG